MKKIITALIAAALTLSVSTVSFADEQTVATGTETINIDGYECYERDGHYWTMLEDGEYLVIDVGDIEDYPSALSLNSSIEPRMRIIDEMPTKNWTNSREINVPHGHEYTDRADISGGDYCSPVYLVYPVNNDNSVRYRLKCDLDSGTNLNIQFFYHIPEVGWNSYTEVTAFTFFVPYKVVFVGDAIDVVNGIAFRFFKQGSDSNISTQFDYTFQAKLPFI